MTFDSSPYALPPLIDDILTKQWGDAWLIWLPETLEQMIEFEDGTVPSDEFLDKVHALQTLKMTEVFWDDPLVFEKIVLAFNGRYVDPTYWQCATLGEIAYAVAIADLIRKRAFEEAVVEYVRACAAQEGLIAFPTVLQRFQPTYDAETSRLVGKVEAAKDPAPGTEVDDTDPVAVQRAKRRDVNVYVEERLHQSSAAS